MGDGNPETRPRRVASLMPFADVVTVPIRNMNRHIALYHGLAPQARRELVVGRLFDPIKLVIFHFGEVFRPLLYHHMARGACAASAARMLQMEAEIHRNIQQGLRTPVFFIRQFPILELERLVRGKESNFWHTLIVAGMRPRTTLSRPAASGSQEGSTAPCTPFSTSSPFSCALRNW